MTTEKDNINLVHIILGHSYLFHFFGLLVAVIFDAFVHYPITANPQNGLGLFFLFVGTLLIYWAQKSTRGGHHRKSDLPYTRFARGPYKVTRSPTNLGIGVMMLGLSFIFNSLSLLVITTFCFFLARYVFIWKEEKLLVERYGDDYRMYRKKVKF